MNHVDTQYLALAQRVLQHGEKRDDRTGTGTRALFGERMVFNMAPRAFPILTTKRVFFRGVVAELLWMLSGDGDPATLTEQDVHIWDAWSGKAAPYGPALRGLYPSVNRRDQLDDFLDGLRESPNSRRHVMTTWITEDQGATYLALPPCHGLVIQAYVRNDGYLDLQVYQRSADVFLGLPFNISSYALLGNLLARDVGLHPGNLTWVGGDVHVYDNHRSAMWEQIYREPKALPGLSIKSTQGMLDLRTEDIVLNGYEPHGTLPAPVSV